MVKQLYPRVEINLKYLTENVATVVKKCSEKGIKIAGVMKGTTGIPQCSKCFEDGGASLIASSRLEQLEDAKEFGIKLPCLLLRVPMLSEIPEVVRIADVSLNSEIEVLKALNEEAGRQGKQHKVIIMADLGDLREGFWDKNEMVDVAVEVENICQTSFSEVWAQISAATAPLRPLQINFRNSLTLPKELKPKSEENWNIFRAVQQQVCLVFSTMICRKE